MSSRPPFLDAASPELDKWFEPHTLSDWRAAATKMLKGKPLESLSSCLASGMDVDALQQPRADQGAEGAPDQAPYTRGAGGLSRRAAGWDVASVYDAGSASDVAGWAAQDLARGGCSVWLVPDGAGQGLAGTPSEGVALHTAGDLALALADVPLASAPVQIEPGVVPEAWWHALLHVAEQQGVDPRGLMGVIAFDPLGTLARHGTLPGGVDAAWDALGRCVSLVEEAPAMRVLCLDGRVWSGAGAHAAQELGLVLAAAAEAFRAMEARDVSPEALCARTQIRLDVGAETFEELSKLRAARLLWSSFVSACGGDEAAQCATIHAVTAQHIQTRIDPWVNMLRGTHGAFVAAVGGADVISIVPFDRSLGTPEAVGRRLATTTHAVLSDEAHLAAVADAAGGAHYVEALTEQLALAAWGVFQTVESHGGLLACLRDGTVQRLLATSRRAREQQVRRRSRGVVGVSLFPASSSEAVTRQTPHAAAWCGDRSPGDIAAHVRAGGSLGDTVRGDVVDEVEAVGFSGVADGWEALREAVDARAQTTGRRPAVFLATLGKPHEHKGRADFAARLYESAGFAVTVHPGATVVESLTDAYESGDYDGVCVAGLDVDYDQHLPALAVQLSDRGAAFVAVAGKPGPREDEWITAGVSHAVYRGCDALGQLIAMFRAVEVSS